MPTRKNPPKRKAVKAAARPARSAKAAIADDGLLGQVAPDVELWDQDGKPFRLSDLRGAPLVLYFYPKDMTTGCTTEACGFNDALDQYRAVEAQIVGVSPDDAESHRRFIAKHGLGFTLASDPTNLAMEAFGVWQEKTLYGRKSMGVVRSTFLLDAQGVVRRAWRRVKPEGHAAEVLAAVKAL